MLDTISRCRHQCTCCWTNMGFMTKVWNYVHTFNIVRSNIVQQQKQQRWRQQEPARRRVIAVAKSCPFHILPEVKSLKNILLCPCLTNCQRNILSTELEDAKHEVSQNFEHCKHKISQKTRTSTISVVQPTAVATTIWFSVQKSRSHIFFFRYTQRRRVLHAIKIMTKLTWNKMWRKKILAHSLFCVVWICSRFGNNHRERERNQHMDANLLW